MADYTITGGDISEYNSNTGSPITNNQQSLVFNPYTLVPPDPPSDILVNNWPLYITPPATYSIYLSWTAPTNVGSGIASYTITNVDHPDISYNTGSSVTNYTIGNLDASTNYSYTIQMVDTSGAISINSAPTTPTGGNIVIPPTITGVSGEPYTFYFSWSPGLSIGFGSILGWNFITDISGYTSFGRSPAFPYYQTFYNVIPGIYTVNVAPILSIYGYFPTPSADASGTVTTVPTPTNVQLVGQNQSIYLSWDSGIPTYPTGFGGALRTQYIIEQTNPTATYTTPQYPMINANTNYTVTGLLTQHTNYINPNLLLTNHTYSFTITTLVVSGTNHYSSPSVEVSGQTAPPLPPTDLSASAYVSSIDLRWTLPSNPYNSYSYYVITDVSSLETYQILDINATSTRINNLNIGQVYTYHIQTVDISGNYSVPSNDASAIPVPKIPVDVSISGDLVQYLQPDSSIQFPLYPVLTIPPPFSSPPNPIVVGPFYDSSETGVSLSLPNKSGLYTVYAYISDTDPYYRTGTVIPSLLSVYIAPHIQSNCSPYFELNALSHGGTFASSIPTALTNQVNRTGIIRALPKTYTPICCPGPFISPFTGGLSSSVFLQNQIQQQAVCDYNQNLAVAKLRQIPGCPVNNDQRFAKYQRLPAATANCMPPVVTSGLPAAINGPCTNVIGISQTWPPS